MGRRQPDRYVEGRADNRLQRHLQIPRLRQPCCGTLGEDCSLWRTARHRLGDALRNKPECFDRTWESKAATLWIGLSCFDGRYQRQGGQTTSLRKWDTFVEPGLGCRCVKEQPWITVAETCELIMACVVAGESQRAATLYQNIQRFQLDDGSWWTGYVFPDDAYWPDETPTWTAGAVLLAADALFDLTPAASLFKTSSQPRA